MKFSKLDLIQRVGIGCLGLWLLIGLPPLASALSMGVIKPKIQQAVVTELAAPLLTDTAPRVPTRYRIYRFDLWAQTVQRDNFIGDLPLVDPAEPGIGVFTEIASVGWDAEGNLVTESATAEASDAGFMLNGGREFAKYLINANGTPFGLVSLVDGFSYTIQLDLSGDRSVDLMAHHDAANGQIVHIVKDRADVLEEYEHWMVGASAYCGAPNVEASAPPEGGAAFGALAPAQSRIDFCDAFITRASGATGADPFHSDSSQLASAPSVLDQACTAVLQQASNLPTGPVFQPPPSRHTESNGSHTASTVGGALEKAGQALMDASSAGRASSGGCSGCATASNVGYVLGGLIRGLGRLLDDPLPGEEGAVDWVGFCQRRALLDYSFSLFELDKKMHERECPDPREAQSAASNFQPSTPDPLATRNCHDPEQVGDLNHYLEDLHSQCEFAESTTNCTDPNAPRDNASIDGAWVDMAPANRVREFELESLPKVINPAPQLQRNESLSKEKLDKFGF